MLRPILPRVAWQAIAAVAGSFALVCVSAAPVDLWRIAVKSRQGEPFRAIATIASKPEEGITDACLAMGPESDAPGSEMPFLSKANLKLDAARGTVEITTDEPVSSPALAMVLRVQCAGAALYARHFTALIPPAAALPAATSRERPATPVKPAAPVVTSSGFHLSLLPGDTVDEIARVLFPGQAGMQQDLVRKVIAGNPGTFPEGRVREVPAGTVLWFPNLKDVRKGSGAKAARLANPPGKAARKPRVVADEPVATVTSPPAKSGEPATLRRALDLGDKPGPRECRQIAQLCGRNAGSSSEASVPGDKAVKLESGINQLHLKQDGIEQQLQRLEQSLALLQKTVNSIPVAAAVPVPAPAPQPPKVEVRAVVQTEPVEWYVWAALAAMVAAAAVGGFVFGRRQSFSRRLQESNEQVDRMLGRQEDERLNRMLATTANVIREFESTPRAAAGRQLATAPPQAPAVAAPRLDVTATDPSVPDLSSTDPSPVSPPAAHDAGVPDIAFDTQSMQAATNVDVELESEKPADSGVPGLSSAVLFEMDQALDNTRSMFTDVDRFIALGRTQNALSLLQFQVHKDPKDRDSWIKLMAIYRQEKMDVELAKAAREFRMNFPNENPPAV